MELPAHTSATTSGELEQLAEEQALGEATNLGCSGLETPDAVTTAVSGCPAESQGKTASSRDDQTSAVPAASQRGQATAIATAITTGPATAFTATTCRATACTATTIRTTTWKS